MLITAVIFYFLGATLQKFFSENIYIGTRRRQAAFTVYCSVCAFYIVINNESVEAFNLIGWQSSYHNIMFKFLLP